MVLANTFEEPFGDIFDKGVWTKLSEKAVSNIRGNVVALASFNGNLLFCGVYFIIFVLGMALINVMVVCREKKELCMHRFIY